MENNLMELWSLFNIVAPGLFPSARRFTEDYRTPIEKIGDNRPLVRLRRRIRPLMMRRTKEAVASDLPPKQEQVLEVELAPEHRHIYETYLQRERQKLLGLIEDMNSNRMIVFRSLTLLRMLSLDASLVDPEHEGVPSALHRTVSPPNRLVGSQAQPWPGAEWAAPAPSPADRPPAPVTPGLSARCGAQRGEQRAVLRRLGHGAGRDGGPARACRVRPAC